MRTLLMALGLCVAIAPLSANTKAFSSNPCCQNLPPFCGSFEVGGEALFFRPRLCDLDYGILDSRGQEELDANALPVGRLLSVPCHSCLGWRLVLGYLTLDRCRDLRLQYTGVHKKYSTREDIQSGCFWASFGSPGTPGVLSHCFANGSADLDQLQGTFQVGSKLDYDAVDVEAACRHWHFCQLWARSFVGIHMANIEHKFHIELEGFSIQDEGFVNLRAEIHNRRRAWGAGPRVGTEFICYLGRGFSLTGRVAAAILTGENRGKLRQHQEKEEVPGQGPDISDLLVKDPDQGGVTPMSNARLGMGYCLSCADFLNLSIEFGYEMLTYINVISRSTYNHTKSTSSSNCQSFTIDGFYLSFLLQL